jgi:pseudaminic acid synthase
MSISVPVAAVALGAVMIEKHFTLDRDLGGPDSAFSLEPEEFAQMVRAVREVEKAMGKVSYDLTERQRKNREFARSLFVVKDVRKGEVFTEENVRSIRPGYGLHPKHLKDVIGRRAKFDVEAGTPLSWDMIE